MNTAIRSQIEGLAKASPSLETGGLVILQHDHTLALIPCPNVAADQVNEYEVDQDLLISTHARGHLLYTYHTHPAGGTHSPADLEWAEELAVPQWVYDIPGARWYEHIPSSYAPPPLSGRQFIWGERDCYTLLRDAARAKWGIHMRDYPRDESTNMVELGALIMGHIEEEGFTRMPSRCQFRKDDILIFRTNGLPQHFGIFEGNSRVLHHPFKGLSRLDMLSSAWQTRLECVCRYKTG